MKESPEYSLENTAIQAAVDLLDAVPRLKCSSVRRQPRHGADHPIDGRIDFDHGDDRYALVIEAKSNGAPRFVRAAAFQLKGYLAVFHESRPPNADRHFLPMLVAPYLSPASRSICLEHNVAYVDFLGNGHLAFDDVYIDRAVADRPKSETRGLRSIFAPKAAAILRVLLRDPTRAWRVIELADAANASLGHVSNVRKALLAREWIEKRTDGIVLAQPDALMRTWREEYRKPTGRCLSGYTLFHGKQLAKRLSGTLNPEPRHARAIYSHHSAAQWLAPFVRGGPQSFYADESGAQLLKETLKLTRIERGAKATVHILNDETLLADAVQPSPGIFCTSPIVTYLDLWNGSDRDREAAEHLASKYFPWL